MKKMNVLELFAGVGGFRVGLERANKEFFETKWANQWEPSRKRQDAFECYNNHFPDSLNFNCDISSLNDDFFIDLQAAGVDMITAGFPCQDYSVASTMGKGIEGKKGVLFWDLARAIRLTKPKCFLLENVDRILKSPSKQRGRDFSIILSTLNQLGYTVEWRVLNSAEYGFPQRRIRTFIFGYKTGEKFEKEQEKMSDIDILLKKGFFAESFPIIGCLSDEKKMATDILSDDLLSISDTYSANFYSAGIMRNGRYTTAEVSAEKQQGLSLQDILLPENEVPDKFYLSQDKVERFKYLRGSKKFERTSKGGHTYIYSEGSMSETDDITNPSRTILTSEGSVNRCSHIIKTTDGRYRLLTPVECERLDGFPDNWTEGMSDRMRYFCTGNALVTGLVEKMGHKIRAIFENE